MTHRPEEMTLSLKINLLTKSYRPKKNGGNPAQKHILDFAKFMSSLSCYTYVEHAQCTFYSENST